MPPTLLKKGALRLRVGDPRQTAGVTPAEYIRGWLSKRMPENGAYPGTRENRVLVVLATTGSGKSTALPVEVFRILRGPGTPAAAAYGGPSVICTQPRVLTAVQLALDVSARGGPYPDMVLGRTVTYRTGPAKERALRGLVFATAGVLAAQLRSMADEAVMDLYRVIIVDEAHERSLDTDRLLASLRAFYERNSGNRRLPFLLLASATIDPDRYARYFGVGDANVIEVEGQTFPIDDRWPERGCTNYTAEAAATVRRLHEAGAGDPPERADALVFVPGKREAKAVAELLAEYNAELEARGAPGLLVLQINRDVVNSQAGDYPLVFAPPASLPPVGGRPPARRVVIATTVAETGLTIDTLRYCIDCGWSRVVEYYPLSGAGGLVTRPASRDRIRQRRGRVGRKFPGVFFPLYLRHVHDRLDATQLPEIIAVGPAAVYPALVAAQQQQKLLTRRPPEFRAEDIDLLDPPPPEALWEANTTAVLLGFVAPRAELPREWPPDPLRPAAPDAARGYGLTRLGELAARFTRATMEGVRVLLAGYARRAAITDLATLVALLEAGGPAHLYARPHEKRTPWPLRAVAASAPAFLAGGSAVDVYCRVRLALCDDYLEGLLVFDAFASAAAAGAASAWEWCESAGCRFDRLAALAARREGVLDEAAAAGLNPFRGADLRLGRASPDQFAARVGVLKRCLYDGLRLRLLERDGDTYRSPSGLRVAVEPLLPLALARARGLPDHRPRWLVTSAITLKAHSRDQIQYLTYYPAAEDISVLDGFFSPDIWTCGPRAASSDEAEASAAASTTSMSGADDINVAALVE